MPSQSSTSVPASAVFSYVQAAAYLGLPSVGALRNMKMRGLAPRSIVYGRRKRMFLRADLDNWLTQRVAVVEIAAVAALPSPRRRGRPTKAEAVARQLLERERGRG